MPSKDNSVNKQFIQPPGELATGPQFHGCGDLPVLVGCPVVLRRGHRGAASPGAVGGTAGGQDLGESGAGVAGGGLGAGRTIEEQRGGATSGGREAEKKCNLSWWFFNGFLLGDFNFL